MGRKKNGTTKTQRKEIRLQKARQWILTYNGTPKHMAKHYRKRFHVDITTAVRDLQDIGVEFTQEYLDAVYAFIAGYTGGGVPYGITWEELGLEAYASYEELMEAYDRRDRQREDGMFEEDEEFWDEEDLY